MKKSSPTKIYTKVVIDMSTGATISEDSFLHRGPMALCEGEGAGDGPPAWTESLPEDVRGWDETKNSDTPEKFWDQMVNMRSRMGQSVRIPSADAGEEDMAAFHKKMQEKVPGLMASPNFDDEETMSGLYSKMGRPAEAKDYTIPEFKNSKGEVIKDAGKALAESLKDSAFKAGLSQKKYEEMLTSIITPSIGTHEETLAIQLADKAKLAEVWGTAHERNSSVVTNFLKQTDAPKSVLDSLEAGSIGTDTMVWIHNLASKTVGKQGEFQNDSSNTGVMTPEEATMKISEIRKNKDHAYNNRMDSGNKAAKAYVRELYLLKDPKNGKSTAPGTQFPIGGNV